MLDESLDLCDLRLNALYGRIQALRRIRITLLESRGAA